MSQPRNYWSYWVHETGHMFKLPDLKYNWNNHGEVDIRCADRSV